MREGDLDAKPAGDLLVPSELSPIVRCDRQHPRTMAARHLDNRFGYFRGPDSIDTSHQQRSGLALHKRHQPSLMRFADDRVDLPVTDARSLFHDQRSRTITDHALSRGREPGRRGRAVTFVFCGEARDSFPRCRYRITIIG